MLLADPLWGATHNIPANAAASSWNTTSSFQAGINIFPLISFVVLLAVVCACVAILAYSAERYRWLIRKFGWLFRSLKYTAIGGGTCTALYGMFLCWQAIVSIGSGVVSIETIGMIVGGYVVFTVVGVVMTQAYARIKANRDYWKKSKSSNEISTMEPIAGSSPPP